MIAPRLDVNGASRQVDAAPDTPLPHVLRDYLALDGANFGCGLGQCGARIRELPFTAKRVKAAIAALT